MSDAATFADLGVSAPVVAALAERGIVDAFPIQEAVIEAALEGRDLCGKAPTGSGKTLAFGVPAVDLAEQGSPWRPKVLILSPTRELATQIKDELEPLAKARSRSIVTVFGGTNIERDIRRLERGVDILVACPGRLEDLIGRRCCELRDVQIAIVDEADRMADMGFLPSVKRILDQTADDRHMLLFSATLDGDVNTLIKRYQKNPEKYEVEEQADQIGDVEHSWYLIQPDQRIGSAVSVLSSYYSSIVFCRTRRGCDRVAKMFNKRGLSAVAIHGDRSQSQRERALRDFTSGKAQVLVATDVAARGIHVDNVALVMHYDPAGSDKDYIHRSGRTGRAGSAGRVISMVVEDKSKVARQLQKDLGIKQGFETLEMDSLPPAVDRPEPEPEPEPQAKQRNQNQSGQKRGGQKRDSRNDRGGSRDNRGGSRNDRGGSNRNNNRNRDDRGNRNQGRGRDSRGGSNRNDRGGSNRDRDDRYDRDGRERERGNHSNRGRGQARRGKNDWYPKGWEDDRGQRGRGGDRDRDDRDRDNRGRGDNRNRSDRSRNDRGGNRDNRGNRNQSRGRNDRSRNDRSRDSRTSRDSRGARGDRDGYKRDDEDERQIGGSDTTPRKNRSSKGRHADRPSSKNKGKRRPKK